MSVFNQKSFSGGMNLEVDDTRLEPNEYRTAFNVRSSTDTLAPIHKSVLDPAAPAGVKQGMITFGFYVILFVAGKAWYRAYNATGWQQIPGFSMSTTAPRVWTEEIPVTITNYRRNAASADDIGAGIKLEFVEGLAAGNTPGLLVQDGVSQPQFIYISSSNVITTRTTQTYEQWSVDWDAYSEETDLREYVPIGTAMAFDGVTLYIVSADGNKIYRSVSGRPLDFVIIVDPYGEKAGDANQSHYSVGVGGISTLRQMADGTLFVAAGNANFSLTKTFETTICGEPTFIRRFLFNATCLSDRGIIDSLGDTRFIDITGIRSFNSVLQLRNEGRNSVFNKRINAAFLDTTQTALYSAAILYNNDELYAVNTVFGPVIAVYDSIAKIWVGFDTLQTGGKRIKQFAKIESTIQKLYAITEDDKLYEIYGGTEKEVAYVRTLGINSATLNQTDANALKHHIKCNDFRCLLTDILQDATASLSVFVNNRLVSISSATKNITYTTPPNEYDGAMDLPEIGTQLANLFWTINGPEQGWKVFFILSWTGGAVLSQLSAEFKDDLPKNPLQTQATVT